MIYTGNWQDVDYDSIPKASTGLRTAVKAQELIDTKFGGWRKATKEQANEAHRQAEILIYKEDHPPHVLELELEHSRY